MLGLINESVHRNPSRLGNLVPKPVGGQCRCLQPRSKGETEPVAEAQAGRSCQWRKEGCLDREVVVHWHKREHEARPQRADENLVSAVAHEPSGDLAEIHGRHDGPARHDSFQYALASGLLPEVGEQRGSVEDAIGQAYGLASWLRALPVRLAAKGAGSRARLSLERLRAAFR